MDTATFLTYFGLYTGTAVFSFLSGFIPIFSVEAYFLVLAAATGADRQWLLLTTIATLAHMAGKMVLFAGGHGAGRALSKRNRDWIERTRQRLAQWRYSRSTFVFLSALVGFPPFYAVAVVAGALKFNLPRFLLAGGAGRFIRFGACLLFPQVVAWIIRAL